MEEQALRRPTGRSTFLQEHGECLEEISPGLIVVVGEGAENPTRELVDPGLRCGNHEVGEVRTPCAVDTGISRGSR
ncbi:MAG: hypothetical protein MAG471_01207 [Acidimicrobiaceae bacterium]|nr:hypothetical protein [Acidimicrobiaceae bacterium]